MPPEIYESALAFLKRSDFTEVRLLGGEPTEHPYFREYVSRAFDMGFRVVVFSGGLVPRSSLDYMAGLPLEGFSVVLNAADPHRDRKELVDRQRVLCRALGEKVMLGVNFQSPHDKPDHLFDWVAEYGLCRNLRVGIAQPIWGAVNDFFRLRGPRVISAFEWLVAAGAEVGIGVGFDCGFTPCMFSREFVDSHGDIFAQGALPEAVKDPSPPFQDDARIEAVGVRCSPVIDILPEGDCIACYALSRFRRFPLSPDCTRNDIVSSFERELLPVLPAGAHRECLECAYRQSAMCNGGCRARRALRLRPDVSANLDLEPSGRSRP